MWPSIPLVVSQATIGSAMGVTTSVQMIGIGVSNLIVGQILGTNDECVLKFLSSMRRHAVDAMIHTRLHTGALFLCVCVSLSLSLADALGAQTTKAKFGVRGVGPWMTPPTPDAAVGCSVVTAGS